MRRVYVLDGVEWCIPTNVAPKPIDARMPARLALFNARDETEAAALCQFRILGLDERRDFIPMVTPQRRASQIKSLRIVSF